ncbi:MAG TPA: hypothetical protein VF239_20440 [Vicinamibacterales bacterium]
MIRVVLALAVLLQPGQRPPLSPAETLLEPVILRAINEQPSGGVAAAVIDGTDETAGEILITCSECEVATRAMQKLHLLIREKGMPAPARTIRRVTAINNEVAQRARAAIYVAQNNDRPIQVVRGLWSTAAIGDEVVEIFARHGGYHVEVRPFENVGQLRLDHLGVPTTTIVANSTMSNDHAAFVAAASAYFLATLPNSGAEALLSHLTVGAHARLAEDGRRAVAMMGNQQRAGGEVLVFFGQAIEREQRRMRNVERYMPEPVDPMLRSRIVEMEKGITSLWTSIGITSSPFVPAAERLRGRAGEDRRVATRASAAAIPGIEPAPALAKLPNVADITYELISLIDGKRSVSDIRDLLAAEFGGVPLPAVVDHVERLAKAGAVTLR